MNEKAEEKDNRAQVDLKASQELVLLGYQESFKRFCARKKNFTIREAPHLDAVILRRGPKGGYLRGYGETTVEAYADLLAKLEASHEHALS